MKYIIVGLGNFGSSLGMALTRQGHEVIAIDSSMQKVEAYKEVISHTICMDATDEYTVNGLPIVDTDIVIVAIGEDQGANVMATALFKTLKAKRLISRSINPLHEKVLQAIGVDDLIHPEKEAAQCYDSVRQTRFTCSHYPARQLRSFCSFAKSPRKFPALLNC